LAQELLWSFSQRLTCYGVGVGGAGGSVAAKSEFWSPGGGRLPGL
jgi:hypothetical protein